MPSRLARALLVPMSDRGPRKAAGIVPVRVEPAGLRVLVLRAYKNWDFPKGMAEPGETLLATACREAREEAGLDDLDLRWGTEGASTAPYAGGKVATYFLAATSREEVVLPVNPALGRPEHHEGRWVTLDEAARLLPPRLQPILRWARARLGAS
jgi:8-oxo-dGTP pyrophosphatase MutT (NUDIX family)